MVQIKNCMMCGTNIESLQLGCRSKQKRFCTICLSIRRIDQLNRFTKNDKENVGSITKKTNRR